MYCGSRMPWFLSATFRLLPMLSFSICSSLLDKPTCHSMLHSNITTSRKPSLTVPAGAHVSFPMLAPSLFLGPGGHGRGSGRSLALPVQVRGGVLEHCLPVCVLGLSGT